MIAFLGLLLHVLASPFRSQASLEAEIVFLRHQLNVLRRQAPARIGTTAKSSGINIILGELRNLLLEAERGQPLWNLAGGTLVRRIHARPPRFR
jgi:hypothetical protein